MQAAIYVGKNYSENLHSATDEKPTVHKLFDVTQKLISEQNLEISGVSELSWGISTWEKLTLVNDGRGDQAHEGKSLCILRDSVICVGKVREYPQSDVDCEKIVEWFESTNQYR